MGDPRIIKDFLFFYLAMLSLAFFGLQTNERSRLLSLTLLFCFYPWSYNGIGFIYQLALYCAGLLVFSQMSYYELNEKVFRFCFIFMGFISASWVAFEYFGFEPLRWYLSNVVVQGVVKAGPLANHTISAPLVSIALLLLPIKLIFIAPFFIWALYLYGSTMAWFMVAVGLIHRYFKNSKWFYLSILVLPAVYFAFPNVEFFSGQERNAVWLNILKFSKLSGGGLGYFHDNYYKSFRHTQIFLQEHNEYLAIYTTFGLTGLFIFGKLIWDSLRVRHTIWQSCLVSMYFLCFGSFPFHISTLALSGIILYNLTIQGENYGFFKNESY